MSADNTLNLTHIIKYAREENPQVNTSNSSTIAHTTAEVTSVFKAQLLQKDSDHKVEIASLKANATAVQERITFLTAELAQARAQVEADRTARVEIAKAEAQRQGVVVNANGK